MAKMITKRGAPETKEGDNGQVTNATTSVKTGQSSNFDLVSGGQCPHCGGSLGGEIHGAGTGITRKGSQYDHVWYLNRKIRSCKCQTCSTGKRKSLKLQVAKVKIDLGESTGYNLGTRNIGKGADGSRWAPRTSNPLGGVRSVFGGFDSHTLPPDSKSSWKKLDSWS